MRIRLLSLTVQAISISSLVLAGHVVCLNASAAAQNNYHEGLLAAKKGDLASARRLFATALEQDAPNSAPRKKAQILYQLGLIELRAADYKPASQHLLRALQIQERALFPEHPDILRTLNALLQLKVIATEPLIDSKLAASFQQKKVAIESKLFEGKTQPIASSSLWPGLTQRILTKKDSPDESADSDDTSGGADSPSARSRPPADPAASADSLLKLAENLSADGRYANARAAYDKALLAIKQEYGPTSAKLMPCLTGMARNEIRTKNYPAADQLVDKYVQVAGSQHCEATDAVDIEQEMAELLVKENNAREALKYLKKALEYSDTTSQRQRHLTLLQAYVQLLNSRGEVAAAENVLKREVAKSKSPEYSYAALDMLAKILAEQKRYPDEAAALLRMKAFLEKTHADEDQIAGLCSRIGHSILNQQNNREALPYFGEASRRVQSDQLARSYCVEYAQILMSSGDYVQGEKAVKEVIRRCAKLFTPGEMETCLINLKQAYAAQGKLEDAARIEAKIAALKGKQ